MLLIAAAERAKACARQLEQGITLEPSATEQAVEGRCGCGFYFAARTPENAYAAFLEHLHYRTQQ